MMAHELFKLDLSSESDSDEELDELVLYSLIKRKKSRNSDFMKKRKSYREFVLTKELSEKQFTNYFRLNRFQFHEVLHIIKDTIFSEECNAQRPIEPEEKLAVFLR